MNVRPCDIATARMGVARVHRHRARRIPRSGLVAFEVVVGGWPVGWALIGRPSSRVLQERGFVEVTRVAVGDGVRNACSMLYGVAARWALREAVPIVTYTLVSESGASLRGAGWVEVGPLRLARAGGTTATVERRATGSRRSGGRRVGVRFRAGILPRAELPLKCL